MNRRTLILTALAAASAAGITATIQGFAPENNHAPENNYSSGLKIISLYPPVTSAIFAMGEQDKLSGRSQYCNIPKEALSLEEFGTGLTPDLEAIAGFKPDLILIDGSSGAKREQLKQIAPIKSLSWLEKSDVQQSLEELGQILKAEDKATQLINEFKEKLTHKNTKDSPRLLLALAGDDLGRGPLWYLKDNSLHGEAIKAAGFNNAIPDAISGPASISIEKLINIDPDLIIILATDKYSADQARELSRKFNKITPLSAVKHNRIGVIHGTTYISTGPQFLNVVPALIEEGNRLMGGHHD